ncbi:MAG: glycoside hydrolase family 3 C-terminal domain-containing protein [Prevotella sp.]|nr:glycoside hydrolase family 3 C-terminal domain-containing protein [Prevotella sp.]
MQKPKEVVPVKKRKLGKNEPVEEVDEIRKMYYEKRPMLPLKKGTRILLTGPNANQMRCLNGGWSYTWQGSRIEDLAEQYNTIYEALCLKFGNENVNLQQAVTYNEFGQYWEEKVDGTQLTETNGQFTIKPGSSLEQGAEACDVIIACIGENSYCETPGNLNDLTLSQNQRELVKALAKSGKPIILVLNEGRPRLIADIVKHAGAVVDMLLPSNYGGDALANLLIGDANFSAKMPYTYPREINSLANYDYKVSEEVGTMAGAYNYDARVSLQWPFGYGLSYTQFEYSNLRTDCKEFGPDDIIKVSVDVKNVGHRAGKEPVLLYSSDLIASMVPDNRRLRDFTKISLEPGEQTTVTFQLPAKQLAFVGADNHWRLEEGEFRLKVGNQTTLIQCNTTKVWQEPNIF